MAEQPVAEGEAAPARGDAPAEGWARDAAIFLPGISRAWSDQAAYDIARRLQVAMNRAATPSARFKTESRQVAVGEDPAAEASERLTVYTISRTDPGAERRLLDIYPLNYHRNLTGEFAEAMLWKKIFLLSSTAVRSIGRLHHWRRKPTRAKGGKEVWQIVLSAGTLALLFGYLILLGAAIVPQVLPVLDSLRQAAQQGGQAPPSPTATAGAVASPTPQPAAAAPAQAAVASLWDGAWAGLLWISRTFTSVVAFLAIYTYVLDRAKRVFTELGEDSHVMIHYLDSGTGREALCAQLIELAGDVAQRNYEHLYIIGYSFGSLVALDTLFPPQTRPNRVFSDVPGRTLVTIGCPYDYIRTFWREHWADRHGLADVPNSWINVYNRRDVLGSNFRNDTKEDVPEHGIVVEVPSQTPSERKPDKNIRYGANRDLSWLDLLGFVGYREHATYWSRDVRNLSCFDEIIQVTHKDDPALLFERPRSSAGR